MHVVAFPLPRPCESLRTWVTIGFMTGSGTDFVSVRGAADNHTGIIAATGSIWGPVASVFIPLRAPLNFGE